MYKQKKTSNRNFERKVRALLYLYRVSQLYPQIKCGSYLCVVLVLSVVILLNFHDPFLVRKKFGPTECLFHNCAYE